MNINVLDYSLVKPETVAWAYDNAVALFQGELERIRSLNEKAAQLAGFAAVVLAILGSLGGDGFAADLGKVGDVTYSVCYFGSAGLLAATILWLVLAVYRPRRFIAVDTTEIENYLRDERLLRAEPWALQIRTMRTIHPAALWAEKGAAQMAARIQVGAALFAAGLVAFLGLVTTLGVGSL